jgi:hypothetical protein
MSIAQVTMNKQANNHRPSMNYYLQNCQEKRRNLCQSKRQVKWQMDNAPVKLSLIHPDLLQKLDNPYLMDDSPLPVLPDVVLSLLDIEDTADDVILSANNLSMDDNTFSVDMPPYSVPYSVPFTVPYSVPLKRIEGFPIYPYWCNNNYALASKQDEIYCEWNTLLYSNKV